MSAPLTDVHDIDVPHVPDQPAWTCRVCNGEWPCTAIRTEMSQQCANDITHRPSLLLYLGRQLVLASNELPPEVVAGLHRRFLGWTRPAFRARAPHDSQQFPARGRAALVTASVGDGPTGRKERQWRSPRKGCAPT